MKKKHMLLGIFLIACSLTAISYTRYIKGDYEGNNTISTSISEAQIMIFQDDFDDGSLGSDWTITGSGGVGTHTYSSSPYSAYHYGSSGSITSKVIDTSSYETLTLSYWIRQGSSSFSEEPDSGEDMVVEYYDKDTSWNIIDTHYGSSSEGTIETPVHDLPDGAMHSGFMIRFRQTSASSGNYDYWHIDDVEIEGIERTSSTTDYTPQIIGGWIAATFFIFIPIIIGIVFKARKKAKPRTSSRTSQVTSTSTRSTTRATPGTRSLGTAARFYSYTCPKCKGKSIKTHVIDRSTGKRLHACSECGHMF